jgi:nitrite reductase (NO-forming)
MSRAFCRPPSIALGIALTACNSLKGTEEAILVAPPNVPPPITRNHPTTVKVFLETTEYEAELAPGVRYKFWSFNGTVPGPMIRVRQGDLVELRLANAHNSTFAHSIDLHAVTGPGGGAKATQLLPGADAVFRFKATNPGLYVYHCATMMIPMHVANGMYGMILVEPELGLARVDREFYVMQGDFYTVGTVNEKGLQDFSLEKMMAEKPEYVVFNGAAGSLTGDRAMKAKVGEQVRIFFGVGGPNLISSFHVIGEIFDAAHPEGSSEALHHVQTTLVPAGGATMVQFGVEVPGDYLLVDHSLSRLGRGAAGILTVTGPPNPSIFNVLKPAKSGLSSGHP